MYFFCFCVFFLIIIFFFFFFNDTATTEIYTLSLHDAVPITTSSPSRPTHARVTWGDPSSLIVATCASRPDAMTAFAESGSMLATSRVRGRSERYRLAVAGGVDDRNGSSRRAGG